MLRPTLIAAALLPLAALSADTPPATDSKALYDRLSKVYGAGGSGVTQGTAAQQQFGQGLAGGAHKAMQDEAMRQAEKERDGFLKSMGFDPNAAILYVFVSHSMDREVIRAYAREALWAGASLVIRGIPNGMTLQQYLQTASQEYLAFKGPGAELMMDPRLFDKFGITRVPAIVLDEAPFDQPMCAHDANTSRSDDRGRLQRIKACAAADSSTFWKVSGQVTIDYALEQFADAGSSRALSHLNKLRDRYTTPGQVQEPFTGDWTALETPQIEADMEEVLQRHQDRAERIQQSISPLFEEDTP